MKKHHFILLLLLVLLAFIGTNCKKNKFSSKNALSKGRIIGYDPCQNFLTFNKVAGAGFVIEIDKGNTKDTTVTYGIPEGLYNFLPSYIDGTYSSFLFRPQIQDLFKITFDYKMATSRTLVICFNQNTADFSNAVKEKEILISCISKQ